MASRNTNFSGNFLHGPQPMPGAATNSEGDGSYSWAEMTEADGDQDVVNYAPDVIRSYSYTVQEAYSGEWVAGFGPSGTGAEVPNQSSDVNWVGARGMADEPLPGEPTTMDDSDTDYDGD